VTDVQTPPLVSAAPERPLTLSVLDLVPVRSGQTSADAVAAAVSLAREAERVGVHRYWVAEHHNMPAVAATNPPVLIALLAGATRTMRIGSGGVMLPNHAPLVVAEQFALLEAAFPGRIDLGIGRAPGSDQVTSWALRHNGPETADANHFDEVVDTVLAMMEPAGVGIALQGSTYPLRATPQAVGVPTVWLLGSSDYSARLAAAKGLPYVFAHHFSGEGTARILDLYRSGFRPSDQSQEPRTFLTVNVVVAETQAEAERLARPHLLSMVALRTGGAMRPQLTVEEAEQTVLAEYHQDVAAGMRAKMVVGTPASAAAELAVLATAFGVDEVMVHPVAGASAADPADRSPAREATLRLLSEAIGVAGAAGTARHR
jgi:luciferase family oxidoreductase group 1